MAPRRLTPFLGLLLCAVAMGVLFSSSSLPSLPPSLGAASRQQPPPALASPAVARAVSASSDACAPALAPAARPWHRLTPPFAAAWQERLEREEARVAAAVHAARDANYWVTALTVFEVSRSYLLYQLQQWIGAHNVTTRAPMGTMAEDAEWLFFPAPKDSLLLCAFAESGSLYGMDSHPCDLHHMSIKGELGKRDLFSWAQTMEHLMDPELAMVRIASHLAPGGWHVTSTPTHNLPHGEPWHFYHHTPAGLALVSERAGLAPVEVGYFGWLLFNADGYTMAFAQKREPTGNNERERFWMGEGAAKNIWGGITTTLDGAAQSMVLSRKGCSATPASDAATAAYRALGARTLDEYVARRPPPASAATVVATYTGWVKGRWGWAPTAQDMQAVRRALGEAEDARVAAGAGRGGGGGGSAGALSACGGLSKEAGPYLALVGLAEALRSAVGARGGPAAGGAVLATEGGACMCAVAIGALQGPFLGSACGAYEGGLPGGTLEAAQRGGSAASLLLLDDLLEYTEDPVLALVEAFYALRPGGWLFVSSRIVAPYRPYARGRVLLRTLTATSLLLSLQRVGFEILGAEHWGSPHHIVKLLTSEGRGVAFAGLERGADMGAGSYAVAPSEWVPASISWALARRPLPGEAPAAAKA